MTLERIAGPNDGWRVTKCDDPNHDPPSMIALEPGTYKHTCPTCKQETVFTVPERPTMVRW